MSAVDVDVPRGHSLDSGSVGTMGGIGGARTPPATPKKIGGKMLAVKILMLDDTYTLFQIQSKALGLVLLEQTCRQLNLLESDYFGLEYSDGNTRYWLDLDKPINKQICLSQTEPVLRFCVKFYPPDPAQLEEEYTRYLFALQIKRDLAHGELQCNDNTAAIMASYIVQAECGDFMEEDYPDHRYLSLFKFVPTQNDFLERRIMDSHKKHVGMTPASADLNLVETARRCDMYGIKLHSAKDHEDVELMLAVAHMGILVFQNSTKINTFSWAKIRKISFKRKKLLIKLHPEGYGYYKDVVEFFFDGRNECKNFWKKCVEHHGFFRCSFVKKLPRHKTRVISRGSSFRYSGRTQKQVQDYVRENFAKRQPFRRSQSFRHSPAMHSALPNVGMSRSAQPLIPLNDNRCVGTPASLSCGSVTIPSTTEIHSPGSLHIAQNGQDSSMQFDPRMFDTASQSNSRQGTLSPESSLMSASPQNRRNHEDGSPVTKSSLGGNVSPMLGTPTPFTQSQHRVPRTHPAKYVAVPKVPTSHVESSPPSEPVPQRKVLGVLSPENFVVSTPNNHFEKSTTKTPAPFFNGPDKSSLSKNLVEEGVISPIEVKKRKGPNDRGYFIVKEILNTERTYNKDLEVINVLFREELGKVDSDVLPDNSPLQRFFALIDPICAFHSRFLSDLEERLSRWDSGSSSDKIDTQKIGDVMGELLPNLKMYEVYGVEHGSIINAVNEALQNSKSFERVFRDFELQRFCYLPLTSFFLKPLYRLQHYHLLMIHLIQYYGSPTHHDYKDCMTVKSQLQQCIKQMQPTLSSSENLVKLIELQRDVVGIDNLVQDGRQFLREGCLQKLSRKGYQQRMFFLFNDVLLYTNRTTTPLLQFKVHGQLPLRGVMVEENDNRMGANNCFTIYGGNRALMVAANSEEDKAVWLADMSKAISDARNRLDESFKYLNLKSIGCSDELLNRSEGVLEDDINSSASKSEKAPPTRSNTTVHVCWHRATTVSASDCANAVKYQLSGYLLRKFKNSMGWQKLWVVFTNFCLFFYKSFKDDFPLASLPLLGYTVSPPGPDDRIQKEFVFKLQFKNHVYFFRAESEYTFSRWMEVISCSTRGVSTSLANGSKEN